MPSVVTCPIAAETRQPARHLSSPVRFLNQWHAGLRGDMLALASGGLLSLAFAPFALSPLAILLDACLLWLWLGQSPRRAAWRGGLFGVGLFGTGMSWSYTTLSTHGHAPAVFAALATLTLILLLALYPLLTGYVLARWAPRSDAITCLLVAPALWTGLEWMRSCLFPGVPWLALGYSQIDAPLGGIAPYLGVFGVSWAVMVSAGLVVLGLRSRQRLTWFNLGIALWAVAWMIGLIEWSQPVAKPLRLSLIQGNVAQADKSRADKLTTILDRYVRMSRQVGEASDVIVWPETAVSVRYEELNTYRPTRALLPFLTQQAAQTGSDFLIGLPSGSRQAGVLHNSVVSFGSARGIYHKQRLVPFGEYLPLRSAFPFWGKFVTFPRRDYLPGRHDQLLLHAGGQPVGLSICFEATFGHVIRRSLPQARFLVNVSNDAWFDGSLAPHQHLQIVRMRAREAGRDLARATNTGITAIIDDRGTVILRGESSVPQVVHGRVQPRTGATPYIRCGDAGVILLLSMALIVGYTKATPRMSGAFQDP